MQKHNKTYRGHGAITDVLCFAAEKPAASCFESAQPELVCDIIIDINQIDRQKGHKTLDEELLDVFIHGLLHGFGYDHIRRQDQITMMEKEIYYKNMMEGT
jgi:rRNA maturation RNase YbeY